MAFFQLGDVFGYQDANEIKTFWASDTAPASPGTGEVWLDTSSTPNQLKRYNGSSWKIIGEIISPLILQTTGDNAVYSAQRTDGATAVVGAAESMVYMGSQSNHALRLYVNNSWVLKINTDSSIDVSNNRVVITSGGNVGIGMTPTTKLDVNGPVKISGYTAWHAGNDGNGSGLDADKIDGNEIETGTAAGSLSGQWNAFTIAFTSTPKVNLTPTTAGTGAVYLSTITTTGFTLVTPMQAGFCQYTAIGPR